MAKYAVRLEGGGCLVKIQEHFLGFFADQRLNARVSLQRDLLKSFSA